MILKGKTMILSSEAKDLKALFYEVLRDFAHTPVSGATTINHP